MAGEFILIVDDEELARRQAEASLKRVGFKTATAASGKTALEIIREAPPDLLLTDIRMPEMDGLDLLARARQFKPDLTAIFISAYGTSDNIMRALQMGVSNFLLKPFTGAELERAVQEALRKAQAAQETARLRTVAPLLPLMKLFSTPGELPALGNSLAATLANEGKIDYCAIFLYEEFLNGAEEKEAEKPELKALASFAGPAAQAFSPRSFPVLRLASRAIEVGRTQVFKRSSEVETDKLAQGDTVPGAIAVVPVMLNGKGVGAIVASRAALDRPFLPEEREMLEVVAGQLAGQLEVRRLRDNLAERNERLRLFAGRFVSTQEEEKRRLAERILSELLPPLTLSRQNVQTYVQKVRTASDLIKTEERLHNLVNQTKKLAQDLRPLNLEEFGLNAALRQYVRDLSEAPNARSHPFFRVEGDEIPRLPNTVEVALFRAAQDAINNAVQHAAGSEIVVTARVKGKRNMSQVAEIEIRDRGPGFNLKASVTNRASAQVGLVAMQERLLLVGAKCDISSTPGQGTRITLSYQIPDEG
ncbi:MAG: response regulator [Chloroflexi bacterium]|nr:response regulator [Chloroflexota bacterium]OJW04266.1 MAG: hypothetical protein BGO39_10875 [Chloroflexi bacterium 54-19]